LLLSGCASTSEHIIQVDEKTQCNPLKAKQGQELLVSLPSDPTTGYRWNVQNSASSILSSVGPEVFSSNDENNEVIGSAGQSLWRFKVIHEGTAELVMKYQQSWDTSSAYEKVFACHIEIQ
jgi:inhibitor of cysteine peptidase